MSEETSCKICGATIRTTHNYGADLYLCYLCAWELYDYDPNVMRMDKRWQRTGLSMAYIQWRHNDRLAISPNGNFVYSPLMITRMIIEMEKKWAEQ